MEFDAEAWKLETRHALAGWRDDLVAAASFLTRLPLAGLAAPQSPMPARPLASVMRAFPLVGILVGVAGWAVFALADAFALPAMICALLAVATTVAVTGALHEDGLADTADGFGGGAERTRKLAIMRDSRSGAYGVLALVFSVALRAAALAALPPSRAGLALVAAHTVSHAGIPLVMRWLEPARDDGLGAGAGQPDDAAILWCLAIALVVALLCLGGGPGLAGLVVAAGAVAALAALARRQIGGYTGDVLGAAQQIGEIAMLLTATAI
ncbi:MAG TPA: adenosylcobinamide-GDP ribazoletransferase [Stellaceae bacterium]|nr:adenosylcobinamide-GDP ribazoletransferase [Stellaceae bacterium]